MSDVYQAMANEKRRKKCHRKTPPHIERQKKTTKFEAKRRRKKVLE